MSAYYDQRKDYLHYNNNHSRITSGPETYHALSPVTVQHLAREWIKEDSPNFDFGGFVVGEKNVTAALIMRQAGVLAGRPFIDAVFKELECEIEWLYPEGTYLNPVQTVAIIKGRVRCLLLGERVALNCACRASGLATLARKLALKAEGVGWKGKLADTRRTTPGFRLVEKYSLLVGGLATHRYDLSSMIILRDNHIWTAGSIQKAVKDAKLVSGFSMKIEVECRNLEDALEAANAGCDVILFENPTAEVAKKYAESLKQRFPDVMIEISGDIPEDLLVDYCSDYIDVISLNQLTMGYSPVNFTMKMTKSTKLSINQNYL
ncbi:nicotinate-nucleotide pyrophosphorylase [carboxylating] isoform X1 [Octopus sinensis]|uniref:Nicotinate-nucleotide pyrophosphorylase [carboxylating] n=1 Tax=Octopus sinensis TaxID=2607531 RepID=A0A6P7SMJ0_9MOLL|nr:nicotinate-nucleotide pyrophosphorylase [carboxylating] isoform X1 [Octopus sinensis]